MALKIGLDVASALRLAAEPRRGVEQGVVIELDEGLERDAEAFAVIEQSAVMIRNPPWPGLDVERVRKAAGLRRAAKLGKAVAAPERPVATSGAAVELQHLDLVAGGAQFERGRHAGETGAEYQHRRALGVA